MQYDCHFGWLIMKYRVNHTKKQIRSLSSETGSRSQAPWVYYEDHVPSGLPTENLTSHDRSMAPQNRWEIGDVDWSVEVRENVENQLS